MAQKRRCIKSEKTFRERLADEALRFREAAENAPPGSHAQELLLRRARQAETASRVNEWVSSPGLQPPKVWESCFPTRSRHLPRRTAWGYDARVLGDDGHVINCVEVRCCDDEEAIRCAKRLVDGHAVVLWQEKRKVAAFRPDGFGE
jgi:hypothetical protein